MGTRLCPATMNRSLLALAVLASLAVSVKSSAGNTWRTTIVPFTTKNSARDVDLSCVLTCYDFCVNGDCSLIYCDNACPVKGAAPAADVDDSPDDEPAGPPAAAPKAKPAAGKKPAKKAGKKPAKKAGK